MQRFFNNKKLIGLLVGVLVVISMMALSLRSPGNAITSGSNGGVSLFSRVFAAPINLVRNFVEEVNNLAHTYNENKSLKEKIDSVYELEVKVADLQSDNQKMKAMLELDETLSDHQLVNAMVIGRNPDNWLNQIVIDQGKEAGLEVGMSVMSGHGLIGKVSEVNRLNAKVMLLSNQNADLIRVSAMIQAKKENVYGTVSGYDADQNLFTVEQVDAKTSIKKGDSVVTSGLGGGSPSGLLIGKVKSIDMDNYGLFRILKVEPAGDMNDIRYVTVVKKGSGGD